MIFVTEFYLCISGVLVIHVRYTEIVIEIEKDVGMIVSENVTGIEKVADIGIYFKYNNTLEYCLLII